MVKKQSRRSISFETRLHHLIVERAEALGVTSSAYMSELARKELLAAGIEPPPAAHYKPIGPDRKRERIEQSLPDMIGTPPSPTHPPSTPGMDPKYIQALEFTRAKLARGESIGPKPRICGWCDEPFRHGEVIEESDDIIVHERCKRAISAFNG